MSQEENKAIVRRFFEEAWNQQNLNVIDEIFAPIVVFNSVQRAADHSRRAQAGSRRSPYRVPRYPGYG